MSLPTPDNPHTERFSAYELVWWQGGMASGRSGADQVIVYVHCYGSGRFEVAAFKYPNQIRDLERMERALEYARLTGARDKATELRRALGL